VLVSNCRQIWSKTLLSSIAIALLWSLWGCSDRIETSLPPEKPLSGSSVVKLAEVAPPPVLQELRSQLDPYQPQVAILEPKAEEVLSDTTVSVKLQVKDLPIFKNDELEMGPHLHLILDNQPYQAVYNADEPILFENLEPGTHTLRVFAARPWHESFKNNGAYAQTTFHIIAPTNSNALEVTKPLLTYSRPKGSYGAEPILLDFYLTNAPLHLVAAENPDDDIEDWRIRVTINGQSFLVDTWQPLYLTGFQPGKNWVKLELLDEEGNPTENGFNTTVRLIDYEPNGQDTLSKLVRGELSVADAQGMIDPNYIPPAPPEEVPTVEEEPPQPDIFSEPAVEETQPIEPELVQPPPAEESPEPSEIEPSPPTETPAVEEESAIKEPPAPGIEETPAVEEVPLPTPIEPSVEVVPLPEVEPSPPAETPAAKEEAKIEEIPVPGVEEMPAVEEVPLPTPIEPPVEVVPFPEVEPPPEVETPVAKEELTVEKIPATEEITEPTAAETVKPVEPPKARFKGLRNLLKKDKE
jgi:hypothetical protein